MHKYQNSNISSIRSHTRNYSAASIEDSITPILCQSSKHKRLNTTYSQKNTFRPRKILNINLIRELSNSSRSRTKSLKRSTSNSIDLKSITNINTFIINQSRISKSDRIQQNSIIRSSLINNVRGDNNERCIKKRAIRIITDLKQTQEKTKRVITLIRS